MDKYCDCQGRMGLDELSNKLKYYECGVYFT